MPLRKINIYVNVQTGNIVSSTGSVISSNEGPSVFLDEKVIFCMQFLNSDGTIYPLDESETLSMALDNDFSHSTSLMTYSDNSMMNVAGDWIDDNPTEPDTGTTPVTDCFLRGSNKARGRVSARMYCNTNTFATKIAAAKSLIAYLELKKYTMAVPSVMMQAKLTCKNIVNQSGGTPYDPVTDYYTSTESDSRFVRIADFNLANPTEVSIVAGVLTRDRSVHKVLATADVDLNTIDGAGIGYSLLLFTENITDTITIKHGTGNILLSDGVDIEMLPDTMYMFNFDGTNWRCVLHNPTYLYLLRTPGDYNTFTEKTTPIDDDIVLIEDSASGYVKAKMKLGSFHDGTKANKVSGAVNGNFAGLTTGGDLTDSGSKPADFEPALTKGNLTEATSNILTISGGTNAVIGTGASIQVKQAATAQSGYLSSSDWNLFNNKISQAPSLKDTISQVYAGY